MNGYRPIQAVRSRVMLPVAGLISAIIAIFVYPLIFGVIGVVAGIFSCRGSNKAGVALIWTALVCMAAGLFRDILFHGR